MARFVRFLLVVMLVVHLVVGYCACRLRACEREHPPSATHIDAPPEGPCSECKCDSSDHAPRGCDGCKCSVATPRRHVAGSSSAKLRTSLFTVPHARVSRLEVSLQQRDWTAGRHGLPIRLHLAYRVLLI